MHNITKSREEEEMCLKKCAHVENQNEKKSKEQEISKFSTSSHTVPNGHTRLHLDHHQGIVAPSNQTLPVNGLLMVRP
ncbi:unnamed protein product [Cercopithifilaria johnstoni]|uniref:Uncharacterized protein n=1 Tax=Cercopithifilaria johnstoni TaxID=2874296 RepID=A0A8J2M5E5_9BILA|nr:unnamed protein product [Cercopithifilaria johnstoni]